jgi:hypothetical protein
MFVVDRNDLHAMDLGAHIHLMEEWNEEAGFEWGPATILLHGYYTRVIQEDGKGGLHFATYITHGEGDIISLIVYTHRDPEGQEYLNGSLARHQAAMRSRQDGHPQPVSR